MTKFYWKPVRTLPELDDAQRLRFRCIATELGIRVANDPRIQRDIGSTDCLSTTEHVLVYEDQRCVATARLALPNLDVARASGTLLGLELEAAGIDLAPLADISHQLAEVSRLCVLRQWHGTAAAIRLYEGLYVMSRQRGARYWVGGVDCKTSILAEADLMRAVLVRRGAGSPRQQLSVRSDDPAELSDRLPLGDGEFYRADDLDAARHGRFEHLPIADALAAFTKRLAATCIGRPTRHPSFPRYVLPMLVDLERLPEATLRLFDRSQLLALPNVATATPVEAPTAGGLAS